MGPHKLQFFTLSLFIKHLDKLESYPCGLRNNFFFEKSFLCIMQGATISAPSCKGENDKLIFFKENIFSLWKVNRNITRLKL